MTAPQDPSRMSAFRARLYEIVFEADTPAGKAFDVGLLALIVLSIAAVCLESVPDYRAAYRDDTVFLTAVGSVVVMMGALMYLVEGPATGFDSIPRGMYWAVVTMTTVG